MSRYYSTYEVAKMCHVTPGSVNRWIRDDKIPSSLTAGGHHRISREDIIKLLESLRLPIPEELNCGARERTPARFLIVDDEEPVRRFLRLFFERDYPECKVDEAGEGFAAGWKANGARPDLVILDLMIPGFNGFRVCEFIRGREELKHTKILAVTGFGEENRERILKLGADEFLTKPLNVESLRATVSSLLETKAHESKGV
ncbi:MAG: response regulator [Candidatus Omnitrophota bacterium]|nr:response regulator [Candidatus Omnitrophota bacterium]